MGYFLVNKQTNIVENAIAWDGDTSSWSPPDTHLVIPVETTATLKWMFDEVTQLWAAVESVGNGGIGDIWDGSKLIAPKPDA